MARYSVTAQSGTGAAVLSPDKPGSVYAATRLRF